MGVYGYKIVNEGEKWHFEFYPSNSNSNVMLRSPNYVLMNTPKGEQYEYRLHECATFIKEHQINNINSKYIHVFQPKECQYSFCYIDEHGTMLYYRSNLVCRESVKNDIESIFIVNEFIVNEFNY